jgi:hypothetical protein
MPKNAEDAENMPKICRKMPKICRKYAENMPKFGIKVEPYPYPYKKKTKQNLPHRTKTK